MKDKPHQTVTCSLKKDTTKYYANLSNIANIS